VNPHLPLTQQGRRARVVQRLQKSLLSKAWPRTQIAGLVLLTGLAGLLASFFMLQAGVHSMALRYPLAVLVAYGIFLGLLWWWLRMRESFKDFLLDQAPGVDLPWPHTSRTPAWTSGQGGDFSGAGASGNFEANAALEAATGLSQTSTQAPVPAPVKAPAPDTDPSAGAGFADDMLVPLMIVALVGGLAFSSLYIVYSAPTLMAELLLDGALSATLYRRLRKVEHRHWISTALRHTGPPFLLTAFVLAAVGWALQTQAVDAHTLGAALQFLKNSP
jgi:hypothetical protein